MAAQQLTVPAVPAHPGAVPLRASPAPYSGASTSPALAVGAAGAVVEPPAARPADVQQPAGSCANKLLATLPAQPVAPVLCNPDRLLASHPAGASLPARATGIAEGEAIPAIQACQSTNGSENSDGQLPLQPVLESSAGGTAGFLPRAGEQPTSCQPQALPQHQPMTAAALAAPAALPEDQRSAPEQQAPARVEVAEPAALPAALPDAPAEVSPAVVDSEPGQLESCNGNVARSPDRSAKSTSPEAAEAFATVYEHQPLQEAVGSPARLVKASFTAFSESPSSPSQLPCSGDAAAGVGKHCA